VFDFNWEEAVTVCVRELVYIALAGRNGKPGLVGDRQPVEMKCCEQQGGDKEPRLEGGGLGDDRARRWQRGEMVEALLVSLRVLCS
jgi:hypothetical protein